MSNFEEDWAQPLELNLDLRNPRMPDANFPDEERAIEYLYRHAALDELINSISASGWLDYEPLIVLDHDDRTSTTNVVIEGNRRLAALKLLNDGATASALRIGLPAERHEHSNPEKIRIWRVKSRAEARDFIGFKHINGAYKWDSFAKAKFATEWLDEEPDLSVVSQRLGDSNNTVSRLVNGYRVLLQSEEAGFDRNKVPGRFAFSHLYTGLARPTMREYLSLPVSAGLLPPKPIPPDETAKLVELTTWLFGQDERPSVIKSQNPDLKRLLEVLGNEDAVRALRAGGDLDLAYEVVEDKGAKFTEDLFSLYSQAKSVSGNVAMYNGDPALVEVAANINRTVRSIYGYLQSEVRQPDNAESGAARGD